MPGAPRHYLRGELLYKHPSGVYFGPNIEWVPQAYFVDSANTLKTDAYSLWGAKVGFDDGGLLALRRRRATFRTSLHLHASIIESPTHAPLFESGHWSRRLRSA